ncbi:uncharacterized protein LOC127284298 [Leptopilina boulardi]|uniref:uncharacterized protein LOC127284298 n=1 Tax=Leptopilina boulardi TaxID=63433 RepID=UPI0021F5358B|nr:uncharacterized protein LOC127284298 [Leptopilina boulardi]
MAARNEQQQSKMTNASQFFEALKECQSFNKMLAPGVTILKLRKLPPTVRIVYIDKSFKGFIAFCVVAIKITDIILKNLFVEIGSHFTTRNVQYVVGPFDTKIEKCCREVFLAAEYYSNWYQFKQLITEIWFRNNLNQDRQGVLNAAFIIPLFPENKLLDSLREFKEFSKSQGEEYANFLAEVVELLTEIGSKVSVVEQILKEDSTFNNVFNICEKQFDGIIKSKSLADLIENFEELAAKRQMMKLKSEVSSEISDTIHKLKHSPKKLTVKEASIILREATKKTSKITKPSKLTQLQKCNTTSIPSENLSEKIINISEESSNLEIVIIKKTDGTEGYVDLIDEYTFPLDRELEEAFNLDEREKKIDQEREKLDENLDNDLTWVSKENELQLNSLNEFLKLPEELKDNLENDLVQWLSKSEEFQPSELHKIIKSSEKENDGNVEDDNDDEDKLKFELKECQVKKEGLPTTEIPKTIKSLPTIKSIETLIAATPKDPNQAVPEKPQQNRRHEGDENTTSKNSNKVVQETSPQGRRHKEDENKLISIEKQIVTPLQNQNDAVPGTSRQKRIHEADENKPVFKKKGKPTARSTQYKLRKYYPEWYKENFQPYQRGINYWNQYKR